MRVRETWNSFWGPLLLRRFHLDSPERWSARERKADWLLAHLAPPAGGRLADLGCGDGVLSICLARRGYRVTAIDRIASVLEAAREEAAGAPVEFVAADLRECELGEARFDGAVFLDGFGLLDQDDQLDLFRRVRRALRRGGALIFDWPPPAGPPPRSGPTTWERTFADGVLKVAADFDQATRVQTILPEFHHADGRVIELHDPLLGGDYIGLRRSLCPLDEAEALLDEAGFTGQLIPHYRADTGYYALLARARGDR